nr:DUF4407 domain-containing protein [uncultured Draconibacterium sp.]
MEKKRVKPITGFICKCAGANLSILEKCPTQVIKYSTMGVILWITAIMASLSGGYFFNTVFDHPILAIVFGIFWGLAIFSLDRYIVTSLNMKKGEIFKNFGAFTRILLAICLGIVVAKPLELKIFEKEITSQISIDNTDKINSQLNSDSTLLIVNSRIKALETEEEKLDSSLIQRKLEVDQYNKDYIDELKGTGIGMATNVPGDGSEAKRKLKIYESESKKYSDYGVEVKTRKAQIKTVKASLEKERTEIENDINTPIKNSDGPLNQLNALHNIIKNDRHLKIANLIITLIFMLFELAPVLVKFSMKRGLYEELLEAQESLDKSNQLEELYLEKYKTEINIKRKKSQYNGEVSRDEQIKNKVRDKEFEMDIEVIDRYFQNQFEKLEDKHFAHQLFDELKRKLSNYQSPEKEYKKGVA